MSDMIEKVARAMWADRDLALASIEAGLERNQAIRRPKFEDESEIWLSQARAGIAALREIPSQFGDRYFFFDHARDAWKDMIQAILTGGK